MDSIKSMAWAVVAGLVCAASFLGYATLKNPPMPEAQFVPAVDAAPKSAVVPVKIKSGTVAVKRGAEASLRVPVKPEEGVIAASRVESSEHPTTVVTVVNTDTGESRTVVREEPLPWLAIDKRGGLGMYYGLSAGQPAVMLQARQALFSVKAVHFQGVAQVVQPIGGVADYFVGFGAEYRW